MIVRATESNRPYYVPLTDRMQCTIYRNMRKLSYVLMTVQMLRKFGEFRILSFERTDFSFAGSVYYEMNICNFILTVGIHRGTYDTNTSSC